MKLSTSTNLFAYRPDGSYIPIIESMRKCAEAGYKVLDINLCDVTRSYYRIADPDWREWVQEIAETAKQLGISFSQSHTPFYNVLDPNFPLRDEYETMVKRSIESSGMLGVKWIVIHAGTWTQDNCSLSLSKKKNMEYFRPHLELARKYNCGIAIENLVDYRSADGSIGLRNFSGDYEVLCDLVDSLALEFDNVGICWDFGHANLMKIDQPTALRYIGKRLKATHVADNSGVNDDHIVPFMGTVDWRSIMPVLQEIDYKGDFTYEIHNVSTRIPSCLLSDIGRYTVAVGNALLAMQD